MTNEAWLAKARTDADKLRALIERFHPQRRAPLTAQQKEMVREDTTAPNAELACEVVRDEIRQRYQQENLPDPVEAFTQKLQAGDVLAAFQILDDTWFGVPETTNCWSFTGFAETVDLLDDPPEVPDPADVPPELQKSQQHKEHINDARIIDARTHPDPFIERMREENAGDASDLSHGDAQRDEGSHGPGPHGSDPAGPGGRKRN